MLNAGALSCLAAEAGHEDERTAWTPTLTLAEQSGDGAGAPRRFRDRSEGRLRVSRPATRTCVAGLLPFAAHAKHRGGFGRILPCAKSVAFVPLTVYAMSRPKSAGPSRPDERRKSGRSAASSFGHGVLEWVKTIAVGFVLFVLLRTFVIQTFRITSGSMEDTLLVGDFLVLSKSAYGATIPGTDFKLPGYTHPQRGDVVVFRGHHEPIDLVKRLVGLPGDTLEMRDGALLINGRPSPETYARHTDPGGDGFHPWMTWQTDFLLESTDIRDYHPSRDNWGPIVVPDNRYFVLGDNRDESLDSRYWGFVDPRALKGKAVVLYFSYDREAIGPVPLFHQVRWPRIGQRVD